MQEKNRLIVAEGDQIEKTREALETIQYYGGEPVTSEKARKTAEHYIDDEQKSQKVGRGVLTFMTTVDLTNSQYDGLLDVLSETEYDILLYSSDKSRPQLVEDILDTNTNVRDVKTGITLTTHTPVAVLDKTLSAIHEHYRTDRITNDNRAWTGGRPPLGFRSQSGELIEVDNFEKIQNTLQQVLDGGKTQVTAADELSCTRKTISKAINNKQRYNLN